MKLDRDPRLAYTLLVHHNRRNERQSFRMHLPARTLVQENTFDARRDADCLEFRFAKEHDLPLRVYVQRKVMLLQDANITD
jgi:hypothetical protein